MEKINIAEILKDCPIGMELDCVMYDNAKLIGIDDRGGCTYPIKVAIGNGNTMTLTKYGQYVDMNYAKCVIFPKGKTTWEGFVPPCKFKDGDIIFVKSKNGGVRLISIYKNESSHLFYDHCSVSLDSETFYLDNARGLIRKNDIIISRPATKEEKEKLFEAIKDKGYKWNAETKTLEKLVEPKFKVGDRITKRGSVENPWIVSSVGIKYYGLKLQKDSEEIGVLSICEQDNYELVPNKFDINTLKPFDKVLIRDLNSQIWTVDMFSFYDENLVYPFNCIGHCSVQCIPYENNEHLLGTTNDCDEYYKTWE